MNAYKITQKYIPRTDKDDLYLIFLSFPAKDGDDDVIQEWATPDTYQQAKQLPNRSLVFVEYSNEVRYGKVQATISKIEAAKAKVEAPASSKAA